MQSSSSSVSLSRDDSWLEVSTISRAGWQRLPFFTLAADWAERMADWAGRGGRRSGQKCYPAPPTPPATTALHTPGPAPWQPTLQEWLRLGGGRTAPSTQERSVATGVVEWDPGANATETTAPPPHGPKAPPQTNRGLWMGPLGGRSGIKNGKLLHAPPHLTFLGVPHSELPLHVMPPTESQGRLTESSRP